MRLLVFTQKVDKTDSILGFFHGWLLELSKKYESIEVICLEKGEFDLPENVTVYSLGKEQNADSRGLSRGFSRIRYVKNFYNYLSVVSGSYDSVFVHMNQEYVLLAGLYWKWKKIPVYLWRNHPQGTMLTRLAVLLSTKVFCTSIGSFTARYKKTKVMPVGIDLSLFTQSVQTRKKYSVCMVGRIAPIKHIELAISATHLLISSGTQISLTVIGPVLPKNILYYDMLKAEVQRLQLTSSVHFVEEMSQETIVEIYGEYELCLNLTETGSFDKTIVEAAACGTVPIVSNISLAHLLPEECMTIATKEAIAGSIQRLLDPHQRLETQARLEPFVQSQSLSALIEKLAVELA